MEKLDLILEKLDTMDKKVDRLDARVDTMESDIKGIKLTLENEVRTNIMRVAEGHMDLSRHLNEAIKSNNEFEMMTGRVNML